MAQGFKIKVLCSLQCKNAWLRIAIAINDERVLTKCDFKASAARH